MKQKHTPGLWTRDTDNPLEVYSDTDCEFHPIADCSCNYTCRDEEECVANAQLIAAAPELLEALQELLLSNRNLRAKLTKMQEYHDYRDKGISYKEEDYWNVRSDIAFIEVANNQKVEKARAAIVKVEGK